jgi:thiamine-monophosphate kinase
MELIDLICSAVMFPRQSIAMHDESSLIELLTRKWKLDPSILKGVGDDCAVLVMPRGEGSRRILFKTDAIAENVHFLPQTDPFLIGRKAIARVLSDFAAMGGKPWAALVTLGRPVKTTSARLRGIYHGITQIASEYGLQLVGGETITTQELILSIAAIGHAVHPPILRSGGQAGDYLYVTGLLGEGWPKRHLNFTPRLEEALWLARHRFPTAMLDLSDGLGLDLIRLAKASNVGVHLDEPSVPRRKSITLSQAIEAGEDYELLFSVSPKKAKKLEASWPFRTRLTKIGMLTKSLSDTLKNWKWKGYDHLKCY